MSKRSLFWGTAEGKLGETVFYRRKGEQCNRAYIARPANPRSNAQMEQRAKFANCVKFYKNAIQAYFKFAYEDKMPNESDYNAFMRHNTVANSAFLTKQLVASNYPALGKNWVIASGRINGAEYLVNNSYSVRVYADGLTAGATTVGAVAAALKAKYNLQEGDIVTVVKIKTTAKNPLPTSYAGQNPQWTIYQFSIDTTSTDTLASLDDELVAFAGELQIGAGSDGANWFGMVFSRITASGLQVSNATLQGNAYVDSLVAESETAAYKGRALQSWSASGRAILQGALLEESEGPQAPFLLTLTANNISVPNGGTSPVQANTAYNFTAQGSNLQDLTAEAVELPTGAVLSDFSASADELTFTVTFGSVGGDIVINNDFVVTVTISQPSQVITSVGGTTTGGTITLQSGANNLKIVAQDTINLSQISATKEAGQAGNFLSIKCIDNTLSLLSSAPGTITIVDANNPELTIYSATVVLSGSKPEQFFIGAMIDPAVGGILELDDIKMPGEFCEPVTNGTHYVRVTSEPGWTFVNWTNQGQTAEIGSNAEIALNISTGGRLVTAHMKADE